MTKPCTNRSAVCPVLLRPAMAGHLRRFHRRRCRHIRDALQFREFFASDVGSCFAHATAFDATYQQTPELPENHPTIVGSVWEQENFILCVWMAIPCTAVAAAQCLASSALFSRFKRYICGLLRRAALLSPAMPRAQVSSASCRSHSTNNSRAFGQARCLSDTPCTYNSRTTL